MRGLYLSLTACQYKKSNHVYSHLLGPFFAPSLMRERKVKEETDLNKPLKCKTSKSRLHSRENNHVAVLVAISW